MASQLKQKDIDFLATYQKKERVRRGIPLWARLSAVPLALLLLFGATAGGFAIDTARINHKTAEAESYLNSAANKQQLAAAQKAAQELTGINKSINSIDGLVQVLATYPKLGKSVFTGLLNACAGRVTLTKVQYENTTGVVTLSATALSNSDASQFVDRLRATKLFEDSITYYGFAGENGSFVFSANCPLKVGAEQ